MRLEIPGPEPLRPVERDGSVEMRIASALGPLLWPLIPLGLLTGAAAGVLALVSETTEFLTLVIALGVGVLVLGLWAVVAGGQVIRVRPGLLTVKLGLLSAERRFHAEGISDLAVIDRQPLYPEVAGTGVVLAADITCLYDGKLQTIARGLDAEQARQIHDVIRRTLNR